MQISVQLYSVRDSFSADPAGTLRRLAEIGFTAVEPYRLLENAQILRTLLAENGLAAPSAHASLMTQEDPARVFAAAADLGVRTVVEPRWDAEKWTDERDIERTAERLGELASIAAEHGVRVGYHNHDVEAAGVRRPVRLEVLADHLDPGWCSSWTPSGRPSAAPTRPHCWTGSASASSSSTSRTARCRVR